jgi:SAM-dependent methyltransferase
MTPAVIHTERMRAAELAEILRFVPPPPQRVLEIGAGSGWQAALLARAGYRVTAVDLQAWPNTPQYPVVRYDGRLLPFQDAAFDVVFSSNVLEHVHDLNQLGGEIRRVLAPAGIAVHVLPSPWWRLWTTATHYLVLVRLMRDALNHLAKESQTGTPAAAARPAAVSADQATIGVRRVARWMRTLLLSPRHGERGSALTEAWYLRPLWWRRHFSAIGFEVVSERPLGIAYTGNIVLGLRLSLVARRRLAAVLGSATYLFVLRPRHRDEHAGGGSSNA